MILQKVLILTIFGTISFVCLWTFWSSEHSEKEKPVLLDVDFPTSDFSNVAQQPNTNEIGTSKSTPKKSKTDRRKKNIRRVHI